jgi:hypothetical protein
MCECSSCHQRTDAVRFKKVSGAVASGMLQVLQVLQVLQWWGDAQRGLRLLVKLVGAVRRELARLELVVLIAQPYPTRAARHRARHRRRYACAHTVKPPSPHTDRHRQTQTDRHTQTDIHIHLHILSLSLSLSLTHTHTYQQCPYPRRSSP